MNAVKSFFRGTLLPCVVAVAACEANAQQLSTAKDQNPSSRAQAMAVFKDAATKQGGTIEPIHVHGVGIEVIVTTPVKENVKELQEAVRRYAASVGGLRADADKGVHQQVQQAIKDGGLTQSVTELSNGVVIHLISKDPSIIKLIQESDCCNWCVCKGADTVNSCKKCCS